MVPHRQAYIVLAIYEPRGRRDRLLGYDFGDEHDAPAAFIPVVVTYVEAEVRSKWDEKRDREELGTAKPKAHEANVCFALE